MKYSRKPRFTHGTCYYDPHELYYYPFTYNTYAGVDPRRLLNENTVSESDLKQVSDSDS